MSADALPRRVYTRADWPHVPGAEVRRSPWRLPEVELTCDAVVVGSGAGGGVVAAELAEGGLDVILLEEGGHHRTEEFSPHTGEMIRKLYRNGGMQVALGSPPILFAEGRCVGGSTVINGGMSWRTPERILHRWGRDHGVAGVEPAEMEPIFQRVEKFLSARHQDPESVGRDQRLFKEGADRLGWRTVDNVRNQVHCAGTNNCAFGCPTGAKRSTLVSYVPRALAFGARVFSDLRVERVVRRGKQVVGVDGVLLQMNGRPGFRVKVRARVTIVAAGAIHTPALLQRSRIRSPSGQIGKNLALHPNAKVVALFDHDVEGTKGVHQAFQVREFEDEGFLMAAVNLPPSFLAMSLQQYGRALGERLADYHRMMPAGVLVEDTVTGSVRALPDGSPMCFYSLSDVDVARLVRGTALLAEALFAAGARRIILPFRGVPDLMGPDDVRALYARPIPKHAMEVMTVHVMGTAAMGADPTRHVCDSFGKVYDAEGLYVADASLFPTPVGVNPMETISALATRTAGRILSTRAARMAA